MKILYMEEFINHWNLETIPRARRRIEWVFHIDHMTTPKCIVESLEDNCDFVCNTADFLEPQIPHNTKHSVRPRRGPKRRFSRRSKYAYISYCEDPKTKQALRISVLGEGLIPIEEKCTRCIQ